MQGLFTNSWNELSENLQKQIFYNNLTKVILKFEPMCMNQYGKA